MKKLLTILLVGLWANMTFAENIDQDGRKWITATEIDNIVVDKKLNKALKNYVFLYNDIMFCYFPEIFFAKNEESTDYLDKIYEEDPGRFSLYTRIFYRLPHAKLPKAFLNSKVSADLQLHDEFGIAPLNKIYSKYRTYTNIKNKNQCKKIGDFIHDDLLKNY
ncbi:hypothetical protein [Rodentibacter pneumotropicus]|uniref:hypothetical protein n=1 Tax=Rodentibacter pneumotropicus TaxID=758 RepID=UPI00109C1320|nr:hypothetical protein [Rodentibacter pneumotropicus]THA02338.1 hypothetical protein D3M72_06080 [Rodentibacter pneumotropicus]THA17196.1 hypothetical protein D3M82_01240 [Rodentibacter pneumotropicus]